MKLFRLTKTCAAWTTNRRIIFGVASIKYIFLGETKHQTSCNQTPNRRSTFNRTHSQSEWKKEREAVERERNTFGSVQQTHNRKQNFWHSPGSHSTCFFIWKLIKFENSALKWCLMESCWNGVSFNIFISFFGWTEIEEETYERDQNHSNKRAQHLKFSRNIFKWIFKFPFASVFNEMFDLSFYIKLKMFVNVYFSFTRWQWGRDHIYLRYSLFERNLNNRWYTRTRAHFHSPTLHTIQYKWWLSSSSIPFHRFYFCFFSLFFFSWNSLRSSHSLFAESRNVFCSLYLMFTKRKDTRTAQEYKFYQGYCQHHCV